MIDRIKIDSISITFPTINYEENVKEVGEMKEKSFEIRVRLIVPSFNAPGLRQM